MTHTPAGYLSENAHVYMDTYEDRHTHKHAHTHTTDDTGAEM